jgi:outer membrane protein assembly factor BamB
MLKKLLFLSLVIIALNPAFSQEISQWRGANRDGIYTETGLLKSWPEAGPTLLWHFDELGDGHSSATVTKDRVFTGGTIDGQGVIFAFTLDGKLLWKTPYGVEWIESWPGVRSTPLFVDGYLYQLSSYGKIVCLKADDGKIVWEADIMKDYGGENIQWGVTENFVSDGNKLFVTVGGKEHNVIALDRMTGKLVWSCKGNGEKSAYCSPTVITFPSRKVLVTQTGSSILGIDVADGKLLWSQEWPNKYSVHANTSLFHDGNLYVASGYGTGGIMLKLSPDGSSIQELWRNTNIDNRMQGYVLINGKIYGSDDAGKAWWVIDWNTGQALGSSKPCARGNIIADDGMLYLYGDSGEFVLAEPLADGYNKVGSFKIPYGANQHWAHQVIAHGKLWIRHGTSLMVYDIKQK